MGDDYYQFVEKAHTLKGGATGKAYRLGDRVEVQVARVDLEQRKIDFALVDVRPAVAPPRESERPSKRSSGQKAARGKGGKPAPARRRAPRRRG